MAAQQNSLCRIELMGTLRIALSDETVTQFPRQKAARLLTFLALHPGQAPLRERLVDLFWPDLDLPAGRASLSTTLTALRRLLKSPDYLLATHQTISLNWKSVTTDAAEFERLVSQAEQAPLPQKAEMLGQAIALHRGEACAGFYDDWALRESERLHQAFTDALRGLTGAWEQLGNVEEARRAAGRWAAADPYCEDAHVRLITLHARAGHQSEARAAAKKLESLWQEEFGSPLAPVVQAEIAAAFSADFCTVSPLSVPALPLPLDTFFGREKERAWLEEWLTGGTRLVTLVGPGGMGKTRLALDFARRTAGRFTSLFASLSETEDPAQLLPALVRALGLTPSGEPLGQLAAYLGSVSSPLLILDNLEQLVTVDDTASQTIQALLRTAPALSCLCTSRLALSLRGERLLPIESLSLPPENSAPSDEIEDYASVQLYVDRARAVRPDFNLTPENTPSVAAVCRQLDGSPLALELAASWVRLLPPRAMWERLSRQSGVTNLETRRSDAPARHHSLRAALDWSWRLLRPDAQTLLARVSVFRGGWTLDAAETICGEPNALTVLSHLLEASLVRVTEDKDGQMRYRLLETVRLYAREQLAASSEETQLQACHVGYFLAQAQKADLYGPEQVGELDRLEVEHDNLRASLDFCREEPAQGQTGLRLAAALLPFWRARSYLKEGEERTLALLQTPQTAERTAARAAALNCAGVLATLQAAYDRAGVCYEEARTICCERGDSAGEAAALHGLGNIAHFNQDYSAARTLFEAALARRSPEDTTGNAASWHSLGGLAMREEDYFQAVECYEQALRLRRQLGDSLGVAGTLGGLGQVALAHNDYAIAADYTREALQLFEAAGQRWTASLCLDVLSQIAAAQEQPEREVRLLSAAMAVRERFGFSIPPAERSAKDAKISDMRARLTETVFDAAWAEGLAFTWDEAVAYALAGSS